MADRGERVSRSRRLFQRELSHGRGVARTAHTLATRWLPYGSAGNHEDWGGMRPIAKAALAALAFGVSAAPATAARPVEGYHDAGNRIGCVMYQNFDSYGNA